MQKNSSVWEAFEQYGRNVILPSHNNPTLLRRWLDRLRQMETQVLCDSDGDPIGDTKRFERDGQEWGPIRWPYKAGTEEASYSDPPITFLLSDHLVAIGSTGWDWKNKRSRWLGFDFDSIIGHARGVDDEIMSQLTARAPDWVEIVRSTRGNGRHMYLIFDELSCPRTVTHTEHAALARSFLPMLSAAAGMPLDDSLDVCGQVLWFHHNNATPENQGYALIRPASRLLTEADVPVNWRDNIEVMTGRRNKVRVRGYTEDGETEGDELDEMTQAYSVVRLEESHLKMLDDLQGTGYTCLWVSDHNIAQTHTAALKLVYDAYKSAGKGLRGLFDTNSPGGDAGKPNCFMRPLVGGGWDVYRFGQGTKEHPLWDQQGQWTHTTFNEGATLVQVVKAANGFESPDAKQGYAFSTANDIIDALNMLGSSVVLPARALLGRSFFMRSRPDGRLVLTVTKEKSDTLLDFPGWVKSPRGWEIMVDEEEEIAEKGMSSTEKIRRLDKLVRLLKCVSYENLGSMGGNFDGWVLNDSTESWVRHPRENVVAFLSTNWKSSGKDKDDISELLGLAITNAWSVTNEPFKPEFPGGRVWNLGASQYVYKPIELAEGEVPQHPHWDRVMAHCGCDLDEYIPHLAWCKEWGIYNGGDYMKAWVACMLRHPFMKLPYLFMYGPQNSGKSIFHEAIALLVTRGVIKADRALTSSSGFNGELMGAILGVIDEVDISKAGAAVYNKIKEWTTGLTMAIHAKYKQVVETRSALHLVQMSNHRSACPVPSDDTRITAVYVPPLVEEIPKDKLKAALMAEAPAFMRTVMDWIIPEATGRFQLPLIETRSKEDAIASNRNPLETFLAEQVYEVDGEAISLSDFVHAFHATLDPIEKTEWPLNTVKHHLLERFPIGRRTSNQNYIGNITFSATATPSTPLVKCADGRLVRKGDE